MEDKKRLTQLEEQLSNTLKAVDKLTADVEAFKDYSIENNKVVNAMLRKLDDHSEQFDRLYKDLGITNKNVETINGKIENLLTEMAADRKLRDAQFEFLVKRIESKN